MTKKRAAKVKESRFHIDYCLLCICSGLLLIGYIMASSSSLHLGERDFDDYLHYPIRQLFHIIFGVILASATTLIPLKTWEKLGLPLFFLGLFLLAIVLIPGIGVKVNGSFRWLSIVGLRIQVSEIVKLISVIYMAGYISRHHKAIPQSGYALIRPFFLFSAALILLLYEPDLGSAVVIVVIILGVMLLSGARLIQFILLFSVIAIAILLLVYFEPYRMRRFTGFIDPWADAQKSGFQLVQALISFGQGGIFGVGLGHGVQKLFYLPEGHTDFLFSVLAEELGLIGVVTVIALFSSLIWRAFAIALKAEQENDRFAAFIAYGIGIWFGFQAFVNMGVNMGILPTKGLTLPLMSYGGGSMIIMCISMALLFRVHSETMEKRSHTPKRRKKWHNA